MGSAGSGGYARRFFSGEKADPEVQIIAWTAAPGSTSRERLARLSEKQRIRPVSLVCGCGRWLSRA